MVNVFLLIFLLSPFLLLAGLIRPKIFTFLFRRSLSRKKIALIGLSTILASFVGIGFTADPIDRTEDLSTLSENTQAESEAIVSSYAIDMDNVVLANISRVIDGDTLVVTIDSKTERVRVIGIDSPETNDPRKSVECFGIEASNKAKELLKVGNEIYLEADPSQENRDRYSRLHRYVWITESLDFGKLMIEDGYAYEYTYQKPYKYQESYKKAQEDAETNKRGLWSDDVCSITPTQKPSPTQTTDAEVKSSAKVKESSTSTVVNQVAPTTAPVNNNPTPNDTGASWVCNCSRTCTQITSCEEAYFQLNVCGCKQRDGDKDGVPCENICPGG